MKFFKYLIFILLSSISIQVFAVVYYYPSNNPSQRFSSPQQACEPSGGTYKAYSQQNGSIVGECLNSGGVIVYKTEDETCKSNQEKFLDGYIGDFPPDSVCFSGCIYDSKGVWIGQGETANGNLIWGTTATSTGAKCGADTPKGEDKPSTSNQMKPEECKSSTGFDGYCNKPSNKQCPVGYKQGSFNNQQICIKPSPDPDHNKPNPNDPNNNNGNGNGKFDDSKIIAAINDSKTAITNSINNAVNSINSSISSINQSITTVANAVNGTTNAVNNNTSAVNAVKSSVDALHNTINAVTTAVDNNTKAVNANGDKVANAVKDNTTATNAVKTAVDSLNASVNAVTTAVNINGDKVSNSVNANGEKITNAVNKGTEATKENGNKLDGIKDGINEGNGILKEIRDGIKNINDTLNTVFSDEGKDEIDKIGTEKEDSRVDSVKQDAQNKFNKLANMLTFSNSPCISDLVINTGVFGDITIKFSEYCDLLALTKILIHLSVLISCLRMVDATVRGL